MEKQLLQVRAFEEIVGAILPDKPTMLEKGQAKLRQKLLEEEVKELKTAKDLNDVADALCDILYITYGTAHEYGMADRLIMMFDEVHRSNMTKFPDGKIIFRKDGKVLKPDSFQPPNLKLILNRRFHLFTNLEEDFGKIIDEIGASQVKRWNSRVDREIKLHLSRWNRFKLWVSEKIEASIKNKIHVESSRDSYYNSTVTITSKRYGTTLISDAVDY